MTSPSDSTSAGGAQIIGRTVVGLFRSRSEAEDSIRDLKQAGFSNEQIGIATRDRDERAEGGPESAQGEEQLGSIVEDTASGMAEGAAVGALTGGVVGSLVGLIGSLLIPGLGPVVVGGVLASTLMGMGIGAATGGLIGALVGMGVPEEQARYFDAGFRQGGTLVTVNAGDATPEALEILQGHGADVGSGRVKPEVERRHRQDVSYSGPERRLVGA